MVTAEYIEKKIASGFPDSEVRVIDIDGIGQHFSVEVVSPSFKGKTTLAQHRMIYSALGEDMKELIHALQIKTSTA